jgi:hypothetical protein
VPATNPLLIEDQLDTQILDLASKSKELEISSGHLDFIVSEIACTSDVHSNSVTEISNAATKIKKVDPPKEISSFQNPTENPNSGLVAGLRGLEKSPLLNSHCEEPRKKEIFEVYVEDFKKLNISERGPCDRCGSRYVDFIEKVTKDRQAREDKTARRVCKKCYALARRKKAESFRTLPGSLNVAGMIRTNTDFGRCIICDSQKATWRDPQDHMHICDSCFLNAGGSIDQGVES